MQSGCQGLGLHLGGPDACKTPVVVFPHPVASIEGTSIPNVLNIFMQGMPAHNKKTKTPINFLDNAGIGLGIRKPCVMNYSKKITGTSCYLIKGSPAVRVTDRAKMNGGNAYGLLVSPGQLKCMNFCG